MRVFIVTTLVLSLVSCNLSSFQGRLSSECRSLFQMFKDTDHWRFDPKSNTYFLSPHLREKVSQNSSWDTSQKSSCLGGLGFSEVTKKIGTPTSDYTNSNGHFAKYSLQDSCADVQNTDGCEYLFLFFGKRDALARVGIVEDIQEKN